MLYLILAVLTSAAVSLVMRLSVDHVKNNISMLSMCYLSCSILGGLHALSGHIRLSGEGLPVTVGIGIAASVLLLSGFLCLQMNVKVNGVVLSGVFAKLGVLVPTLLSVLLFKERPGVLQITGFVLAILAILVINSGQDSGKAGSKAALILLLLINGLVDFMSKIYEEVGSTDLQDLYLLISFFAALILSILLAICKKQHLAAADVGFGLLLGIPNYYASRFLIKALNTVPAVVAYPTYSVATIVVIAVAGLLLFREKLSRRQMTGMAIILAALALLNL